MFEWLRRFILKSIEEKGKANRAPIVNFPERAISVEGEDIFVGQSWLERLLYAGAFYLALPPDTFGVVVYPDGTTKNLLGGIYEAPAGVYRVHYIDSHERIDISGPIAEMSPDGEKITLKVIVRYRVIDPLIALYIANPVETLMEYIETDLAQYIRTHNHNEIMDIEDNTHNKLFVFFSERHGRRKPLSHAISITGIEIKEFIGDMAFVEMRRQTRISQKQNQIERQWAKYQEELKRLKAHYEEVIFKSAPDIIFISYRRADSADIAGRIYDRLVERFGKVAIFKDVDSIPLGIDFKEYLEKKVSECNIFLAIIGNNWLGMSDSTEKNRLDDPNDFVRIEIESVLVKNIPVIPLLVGGAVIPAEEKLPISLRKLIYRNGIPIRSDPDFHKDMNRLMFHIESYL